MKVSILIADKPTVNGRIYPKAVIERALVQAQERARRRMIAVHIEVDGTPSDSVGIVNNLSLEGDKLQAEVEFSDSPDAQSMASLAEAGLVEFTTNGTGSLDGHTVGPDYKLESVTATIRSNEHEKAS